MFKRLARVNTTFRPRSVFIGRAFPSISSFHTSAKLAINFDPYKTLGVDKSADQKAIKKAYYDLVKKHHPDVNKTEGAEEKFHKIQESYELLSDKEKRAQYDTYGQNFDNPFGSGQGGYSQGNPFGGSGQGNPFGGMGFDFEDLFRSAFNGGGRQGGGRGAGFVTEHVGDDIEILKSIPFKDSVFGKKIKLNYKAVGSCGTCKGTGLKSGKKKSTCPTCHGSGHSTHVIGGFHMSSTCGTCGGAGVTINKSDQCNTCHGHGVEEIAKSTEIDIPPGIKDGSRLRVPSMGDAPMVAKDAFNTIRNGDLIVRINVEDDKVFKRRNNKIVTEQDILMTTASLGGEIIVPTIDGQNVKIKVRSGTQNGATLNIPNKGMPINRNLNNRDDMEVVLNVKSIVPETPIQRALLEALADTINDKNAKRSENHEHFTDDSTPEDNSKLNKIGKMLSKFFNLEKKL